MSERKINPIFDTKANIDNKETYPYIEGQVFFATDINKFLEDKNGQRVLKSSLNSIEIYDQGITEFYQRGTAGFEGELVLARSGSSFKLYYVDSAGSLFPIGADEDDILEFSSVSENGFTNFTLNFYAITDKPESQISNIAEPENISGTIDFSKLEVTNLTFDQPVDGPKWTTSIEDLAGDWEWNGTRFVLTSNLEEIDEPNAKIIVSQVALFSKSTLFNFSGLSGDNPSLFVKEGLNQKTVFLYQGTETETPPSAPSGNLVFNFSTNNFIAGMDTEGWSTALVGINSTTNRYVWITGAAVASNINQAVISSEDWSTPELFERFAEDGAEGPQGPQGIQGIQGPPGEDGSDGEDGAPGPGVVYQGEWVSDKTYYGTSVRADIVFYNDFYYYCKDTHTSGSINPTNTQYWEPFEAEFDSVATNILLTANANITKALVMGAGDNKGIIKSAGVIDGVGIGFYMDGDGILKFGDFSGDGQSLTWDNTNLSIKGNIEADSGKIGSWSIQDGWLQSTAGSHNSFLTDSFISVSRSDAEGLKTTELKYNSLNTKRALTGSELTTSYAYDGIDILSTGSVNASTGFEIKNNTSGIILTVPSSSTINLNGEVTFDSVNYGTAAPSEPADEGQIYFQHE